MTYCLAEMRTQALSTTKMTIGTWRGSALCLFLPTRTAFRALKNVLKMTRLLGLAPLDTAFTVHQWRGIVSVNIRQRDLTSFRLLNASSRSTVKRCDVNRCISVSQSPGVGTYDLQSYQGVAADRGLQHGGAPNNFTLAKNGGMVDEEYGTVTPYRQAFNTKVPPGMEDLGPWRYDAHEVPKYKSFAMSSNFSKDNRFKSHFNINPGPGNYGTGRCNAQWNKKSYNMRANDTSAY